MRFVLDQGVPRDAAAGLREHGYECVHVGEAGMQNAADDEILAWSGKGSVVVTLDADFHAILAVSGASGPSVIRLRIQWLRAPDVVTLDRESTGRIPYRSATWILDNGETAQDHVPSATDRRKLISPRSLLFTP